MKNELTQKRLKELLDYNPDTGKFIRLTKPNGNVNAGEVAGTLGSNGYIVISVDDEDYKAHRLAFLFMEGRFPECYTDHKNHIKWDNRWINLRKVTQSDNCKNSSMYKTNKSGFTGISWDKQKGKWKAQISVNRKVKNLGRYNCIIEAIGVRILANVKYGFYKNHGVSRSR